MNKSKSNQLMKEGLSTLKYTLVSRHPRAHVVEQKQWRNIRFSFIPSFPQTLVLSFDGKSFLKGPSHEMDLAVDDMHGQFKA
jgi:hypothetical protein